MHFLLRSTKERTRSGLRKSVSHRINRVRPARRFARTRRRARAAIAAKRLQRRATLRSTGNIRARHPRVLFDSWRTGSVRTTAETADSNDLSEVSVDFGL